MKFCTQCCKMRSKIVVLCLQLLTIFVGLAASLNHDDSSQTAKCRKFLALTEKDGASVLLQKAEYMRAYETCTELLGKDDNSPQGDIPTRMKHGGFRDRKIFGQKRRRFFRKQGAAEGNIDDTRDCKVEFYRRSNFQAPETRTTLRDSSRNIVLEEKSIRTFGQCCWELFSGRGYHGRKAIVTGNESLASSVGWGWPPGTIRSIKIIREC